MIVNVYHGNICGNDKIAMDKVSAFKRNKPNDIHLITALERIGNPPNIMLLLKLELLAITEPERTSAHSRKHLRATVEIHPR